MLGKILRIDVGGPDSTAYTVPPDNPFVSTEGAEPSIFLYGLRNPWRFSFDRATGDLWIGDVGQGAWEEVDVARKGTSGENYGWNRMEATHCFRPSEGCDRERLTMPSRSTRTATAARDRRLRLPRLGPAGARRRVPVRRLLQRHDLGDRPAGDQLREPAVVGQMDGSLSSFGEDEAGELYATDISAAGSSRSPRPRLATGDRRRKRTGAPAVPGLR
jgi:hypothetical protein